MDAAVNDDFEFRFVAGHRVLDFLATLGNRHRSPLERLRTSADLDRWLAEAGLPVEARASARDLAAARRLRETINRLVRTTPAPEADVTELNEWSRRPPLAPQIDAGLDVRWAGSVRDALALIARDAAALLASPERALIRECAAAPECSLLYLDRSRGRRRRWCEMERCGSRAKMTTYRRRRAAT